MEPTARAAVQHGSFTARDFELTIPAVGCLGLLLIGAAVYVVSALFWGWAVMEVQALILKHSVGTSPGYWTTPWGYWQALVPWGMLLPFCLG